MSCQSRRISNPPPVHRPPWWCYLTEIETETIISNQNRKSCTSILTLTAIVSPSYRHHYQFCSELFVKQEARLLLTVTKPSVTTKRESLWSASFVKAFFFFFFLIMHITQSWVMSCKEGSDLLLLVSAWAWTTDLWTKALQTTDKRQTEFQWW